MENGASILKKLGIIFLCIGTLGVSGSLILCFIVPSLWLFSIIFGSVLAVFLIVGIICMIIYSTKKGKKEKLIATGKYIYADIVDIDVNVYQKVQIDRISMNPYFIVCKYVEANGKEHLFKSKSVSRHKNSLFSNAESAFSAPSVYFFASSLALSSPKRVTLVVFSCCASLPIGLPSSSTVDVTSRISSTI
jgi:hypothetical protein